MLIESSVATKLQRSLIFALCGVADTTHCAANMLGAATDVPPGVANTATLTLSGKTAITTPKSNDTDLKKIDFS